MHEIGLVNAAAAELVRVAGDQPVRAVTVRIGPKVVPDVAQTAWQLAVSGTVVEQALVRWEPALDRLACFVCGHEYDGDPLAVCPACGGDGLVIGESPEVSVAGWS